MVFFGPRIYSEFVLQDLWPKIPRKNEIFFFTYSQIHIFCLLLQSRLKNNSLFHWGYNPSGILTLYRSSLIQYPHGLTFSTGHWNQIPRLPEWYIPSLPAFPLNTVSGPQNIFSSFYTNLFCRIVSFSHETWWQLCFPGMPKKAQQMNSNFLWTVNIDKFTDW